MPVYPRLSTAIWIRSRDCSFQPGSLKMLSKPGVKTWVFNRGRNHHRTMPGICGCCPIGRRCAGCSSLNGRICGSATRSGYAYQRGRQPDFERIYMPSSTVSSKRWKLYRTWIAPIFTLNRSAGNKSHFFDFLNDICYTFFIILNLKHNV